MDDEQSFDDYMNEPSPIPEYETWPNINDSNTNWQTSLNSNNVFAENENSSDFHDNMAWLDANNEMGSATGNLATTNPANLHNNDWSSDKANEHTFDLHQEVTAPPAVFTQAEHLAAAGLTNNNNYEISDHDGEYLSGASVQHRSAQFGARNEGQSLTGKQLDKLVSCSTLLT